MKTNKLFLIAIAAILLLTSAPVFAQTQNVSVSNLSEPISGVEFKATGDVEKLDLEDSILSPIFMNVVKKDNDISTIVILSEGESTAQGKLVGIEGSVKIVETKLLNRYGNKITGNVSLGILDNNTSSKLSGRTQIILKAGQKALNVNGTNETIDVAPFIKDGRTLAPLRFISEYLGAAVQWNSESEKVVIQGKNNIELTIGSKQVKLSGKDITTDVAPELYSGRTMVPLRFISETFGAEVNWDGAKEEVTILSR